MLHTLLDEPPFGLYTKVVSRFEVRYQHPARPQRSAAHVAQAVRFFEARREKEAHLQAADQVVFLRRANPRSVVPVARHQSDTETSLLRDLWLRTLRFRPSQPVSDPSQKRHGSMLP